jgi:hypothetical protein
LEIPVLNLLLLILLLWAVLAVLVTAWSVWFQGYLYTEAAAGIMWRGPAAGSAVLLVLLVWVLLDYRNPGNFRPLFEGSSTETSKPFAELRVPKTPGPGEDVYKLMRGTHEYRLNGQPSGKPLPSRPSRIIVVEGGEKFTFEPERDSKGNFKTRQRASSWFGSSQSDPLRYIDGTGRVMEETTLGQIVTFRSGRFFVNVVLNIVFFAVWFVALWVVVRFQWSHALLQAAVFWIVMMLFVLPPLLTRVEAVAKERAEARTVAP